jgi:hypothetical protein
MTRTVVALLMLALLATVAGGAQCVVRCASPIVPPTCHHHSQGKQSPPAQACAAEMLAGEVRADIAVASPVIRVGVVAVRVAQWRSEPAARTVEAAAVFRHTILRI